MADEAIAEVDIHPDPEGPVPPKGSGGKLLPMAVISGAVVLGLALGSFVIAPQMASGPKEAQGEHSGGDLSVDSKKPHKEGKKSGHRSTFEVESIVVNPAGAPGRFLMASFVFETVDSRDQEALRDHEYMVTDAVIGILGNQTLESLALPGARDSLKVKIGKTVAELIGARDEIGVYMPQFMVQ